MKQEPHVTTVKVKTATKRTVEAYAASRKWTFIDAVEYLVATSPKILRFLQKKESGK